MTVFLWVLLTALFAASAFFSAAESALTALSPIRMKRLAITHPPLIHSFDEWLSRPHRFLSFILVGNNLVNVGISSLAALLALPLAVHMRPIVFDIGLVLVITLVLLVFCEILPKIIARAYREQVSVAVLPLLGRCIRAGDLLTAPFVWLAAKTGIDRLAHPKEKVSAVSVEELQHVIGESEAAGHMNPLAGEMMRRVLELPERTVGRVMIPLAQVDSVPLEIIEKRGLDYFIDLVVESGHSRVPLGAGGDLVSYIRAMDILLRGPVDSLAKLKPLLQTPLKVLPSMPAVALLEEYQKTGVPMAFVIGSDGKTVGIATLEDVLEEIVGEILDEYDLEAQKP
jgi:putative hemolysin